MHTESRPPLVLLPAITLALIALGCVAVLLAGARGAPDGPAVTEDDVRRAAEAVATLEQAALHAAEERGRAYMALRAPPPPAMLERTALHRSRAHAHGAIERAITRLAALPGDGAPSVRALRAEVHRMQALRDAVDAALAVPLVERPTTLARRWFLVAGDLVAGIHRRAAQVQRDMGSNAEDAALNARRRRAAWRLMDLAGRERALVGAAIAARRPLDTPERSALVVNGNRLATEWRRLEVLYRPLAASSGLQADLTTVRRALFEDLARARARVLRAGGHGSALPLSAEKWFTLASRSIGAVLALQRSAARTRPAASAASSRHPQIGAQPRSRT